jgi:hypothetical protein
MAKSHKTSRTYIRGYTRADGVKVKGHYSHPKGRSSRKHSRSSSHKSSRKCSPPKSQYVRSFKRSNGKRVKGHCSRPRGKSVKCSPPKSLYIRSFKRSNGKRVKGHCSRPRGGRQSRKASPVSSDNKPFIAKSLLSQSSRPSSRQRSPACSSFSDKDSCVNSLGKSGLRRCRYNMTSNVCEQLPKNLRQRATFQVGGGVVGQQQEDYVGYSAKPGKLSADRLQPYQGNAFFL